MTKLIIVKVNFKQLLSAVLPHPVARLKEKAYFIGTTGYSLTFPAI
jgi:hypothetical protein